MSLSLDRTSLRLVELLQADARMSISDIARRMNRADSTVRERIVSLERQGVLRGYRALIDSSRIGFKVQAFINAECDLRQVPEITKGLAAIPNVVSAGMTSGSRPLRIRVFAEDFKALEHLLERRISGLPIDRIETNVVLQPLIEDRPLQLAASHPPEILVATPPRREPTSYALAGPSNPY